MDLPQELLDAILSHLHPDDEKSLRACSLVAKQWVHPARRRLFSSVTITEGNYQSWKDCISPASAELLSHVRSLRYFIWSRTIPGWDPPLVGDFFNYLPSFCHLQTLALSNMRINSDIAEQIEVFSPFRHTLSSLSFSTLILTWFAFTTLVDYFPDLRDLQVEDPIWEIDHREASRLSRPLRGRLSIDMYEHRALPIFSDRLSELEVEYDELLFLGDLNPRPSTEHYQRVIDICGACLRRLRLSPCILDEPVTLSLCPQLRRFEIIATVPGDIEHAIISSITSTNLRTIAFLPDLRNFTDWKPFDDITCELVDKLRALGYEYTLELEFRFESAAFSPDPDFRYFLPKFREKGHVRIISTPSEKVLDITGGGRHKGVF